MIVMGELTCIDPEVAVTVIDEVTGLVVEVVDVPPHAEMNPKPVRRTTSSRSKCMRFLFLKPRKQSATARVAGKNGLTPGRTTAAVAGGVTVSVVVPVAFSAMVTGLGLKAQV